MRNIFKKIFGVIAAASFAGIFGFYFKQADIGYSAVCIGIFLTSLCIACVNYPTYAVEHSSIL